MKDAKNRLLKVALELFASKGIEGASTREIAQRAKVNISAITYYFGGKEELYAAVLEYIKTTLKQDAASIIKELNYGAKIEILTVKEAKTIFHRVYEEVLEASFKPKNMYISMILAKESVNPSKIAIKVLTEKMFPLTQEIMKLVAKITGLPKNSKKAILITEILLNKAMTFGRDKTLITYILGMKDYDEKTITLIKNMLLEQADLILDYYTKEKK
ncbi:MAG: CerR family C-terminal domain-containing protein [Elusimicrobiaceae bacterium]|nr:CerR family C-terminal domain-containing protein [Elusimicrobiaceae bacterium]